MCCGWLSTSDEVIHDDEHARWLQAGKERAMMGARGWGKKIRKLSDGYTFSLIMHYARWSENYYYCAHLCFFRLDGVPLFVLVVSWSAGPGDPLAVVKESARRSRARGGGAGMAPLLGAPRRSSSRE